MVTVLELLAWVPAPQVGSPYTPLTHFGFNPFASKLSSNYIYPAVPSAASWAPDSSGEVMEGYIGSAVHGKEMGFILRVR